jgi:ketosteroid isomerase-like protein
MSNEKWPWPDSLDAMIAAPKHHRLVFENDRVRVLDTLIPPGDTVPVHTHRWPAVYYTIQPGEFIRRDGEGSLLFDSRTAPPRPSASFLDCLPPHSVENVGSSDIHLISFELKEEQKTAAENILALERAALERWGRGDPGGYEEISAPDVSYFDPFTETRLDGIDALRTWYDQVRGKIHIDRFEILDPRVQVTGDVAVLTFRFLSHGSEGSMHWNATEVYRQTEGRWRIIHTHWSFHKPQLA